VRSRLLRQAQEKRDKEQEDNEQLAFMMPHAKQMFNVSRVAAINIYETQQQHYKVVSKIKTFREK
jgi:hypothetical protein